MRREKRQNLLNFAVELFVPARGTPVFILRVFWKAVLRKKICLEQIFKGHPKWISVELLSFETSVQEHSPFFQEIIP